MDISIRSEGCNDPDKTAGTCGIAYIYVDGADQSLHGRGHNVVVLDIATGSLLYYLRVQRESRYPVVFKHTKYLTRPLSKSEQNGATFLCFSLCLLHRACVSLSVFVLFCLSVLLSCTFVLFPIYIRVILYVQFRYNIEPNIKLYYIRQMFFYLYVATVLDKRSYDTHGDAAAGKNLGDYLSSITGQ